MSCYSGPLRAKHRGVGSEFHALALCFCCVLAIDNSHVSITVDQLGIDCRELMAKGLELVNVGQKIKRCRHFFLLLGCTCES